MALEDHFGYACRAAEIPIDHEKEPGAGHIAGFRFFDWIMIIFTKADLVKVNLELKI